MREGRGEGSVTLQLCQTSSDSVRHGPDCSLSLSCHQGWSSQTSHYVEEKTDRHNEHAWLDRGELKTQEEPSFGGDDCEHDGEHRHHGGTRREPLGRGRWSDGQAENEERSYQLRRFGDGDCQDKEEDEPEQSGSDPAGLGDVGIDRGEKK